MLNVANIENDSVVDGEGFRLAIFEQGCLHNCKGCQNPATHCFDVKNTYEVDELVEIVKENPLVDGVTLTGGDPFFQAHDNIELIKKLKELGYNIWAYTGFSWDEFYDYKYNLTQTNSRPSINDDMIKMLESCDVLVDGQFELEHRTLDSYFKGSTNQRIIDVRKSIGKAVPVEIHYKDGERL